MKWLYTRLLGNEDCYMCVVFFTLHTIRQTLWKKRLKEIFDILGWLTWVKFLAHHRPENQSHGQSGSVFASPHAGSINAI